MTRYYHLFCILFLASLMAAIFDSCVVNSPKPGPTPTPTAAPTSIPTLMPTPTFAPILQVTVPSFIKAGQWTKIYAKAAFADEVWVYADSKYVLGAMDWDSSLEQKYLEFKMTGLGVREIEFRVNGIFVYAQKITVTQ